MAEHDVSRRDFLKRGAALGGAVVWATPVVQMVGMRPAFAEVASPACTVWYAIKIELDESDDLFVCDEIHDQSSVDLDSNSGKCLDVVGLGVGAEQGGCDHFSSVLQSVIISSDGNRWTVPFPRDCQFVHDSGYCAVKVGQGQTEESCIQGACTWNPDTWELVFEVDTQNDISHVEFAFCCED